MVAYKLQEDKAIKDGKQFEGSVLTISILEGQNVPFDESNIGFKIGDRSQSSMYATGAYPSYNAQLKFMGVATNETITILINDNSGSVAPLTSNMQVSNLSNQRIHDIWVEFREKKTSNLKASGIVTKVHFQLQYVFCRSKIAEEAANEWKNQVTQETNNLNTKKNDLKSLYSNFDFLTTLGQRQGGLVGLKTGAGYVKTVNSKGNFRATIYWLADKAPSCDFKNLCIYWDHSGSEFDSNFRHERICDPQSGHWTLDRTYLLH